MPAVYFFSVVAFKHMFVVDIHFWNVGSFTCFKVGDFLLFLVKIFCLVFQFISQSIYRVNKFMGSCCVDLLDV